MDMRSSRPCFALLPEELQRRILESLLDRSGPSTAVRNAVLVCKLWQKLAQPLLFRDLWFSDVDTLEAVTRLLIWKKHATGYNPGSSCKALTLTNRPFSNGPLRLRLVGIALSSMLSMLPHLERFTSHFGHDISHHSLLLLVQSAKDTLTFLDVWLAKDASYPNILLLIGQLHALKTLHLRGRFGTGLDGMAESPPLLFNYLSSLTWDMPAEAITALARSRFPALQYLGLGFTDLYQPEVQLAPLRASHPSIHTLCLDSIDQSGILQDLLGLPLATHTIEFAEFQPHPESWMPFLPGCVRRLKLPAGCREDNDDIIAVLAAAHARYSVPALKEICLGEGINWAHYLKEGPADSSYLYGHVLYHALRLAEKGIVVTDDDGACVLSLKLSRPL